MSSNVEDIAQTLNRSGINLYGVADGSAYQDILEGCQSVVVFANGGQKLWIQFLNYLKEEPKRLTQSAHPLDDFIKEQLSTISSSMNNHQRWIRCAATEETFVDFRPLAIEAGLGHHSHMGLVIHPKFGLWISLRAALFTTEKIKATGPLYKSNPCTECPKHCAKACPGNAFTAKGLSIQACADAHQHLGLCADRCESRLRCPIGDEHRHSNIQHHYHSSRSTGRLKLAKFLGVPDNTIGLNPRWNKWGSDL